jgi:predicted AAA+ superfamily ATPase
MYIPRAKESDALQSLSKNAVTAIIGPRQSGKSTMARKLMSERQKSVYLDLERPSDLQKLTEAEWYFNSQKGNLICLDEIQRKPDIFPLIRSLVDEWGGNGHFLVLGSSSDQLMKQSSESLAGRISYQYLSPFLFNEVSSFLSLEEYIIRGGFPRSVLTGNINDSLDWRHDFITTFLERSCGDYGKCWLITTVRPLIFQHWEIH